VPHAGAGADVCVCVTRTDCVLQAGALSGVMVVGLRYGGHGGGLAALQQLGVKQRRRWCMHVVHRGCGVDGIDAMA
jgi:hypothetical protein